MFVSNGNYIFRGVEERTSNKTGNIYRIVKIADADNYQQLEFFLRKILLLIVVKIQNVS
ncbi:hypothetical protein IGJ48_001501 [Enterococcus pernyi]